MFSWRKERKTLKKLCLVERKGRKENGIKNNLNILEKNEWPSNPFSFPLNILKIVDVLIVPFVLLKGDSFDIF